MTRDTTRDHRRGLTITEVLLGVAAAGTLTALVLPSIARAGGNALVTDSLNNLRSLGIAHAIYAADFGGRQLTYCPDELAAFGSSPYQAFVNYENALSVDVDPLRLGWGALNGDGAYVPFAYDLAFSSANAKLYVPANPTDTNPAFQRFGSFRIPNATQFNQYLSGRFYDDTFYAASDPIVWPLVEPLSQLPDEYVDPPPGCPLSNSPGWSSYIMSPTAMLNPLTVTAQRDEGKGPVGGWANPWDLDEGFASPGLFQARYANLKTLMIEHHWLQSAPIEPCNPGFDGGTYGGCEPYYFNHGLDSAPATLFYDLSTRLLPNTEAVAADDQLRAASGDFDGTWLRTTPLGEDGYFSDIAFDSTRVSHHIFTADGILGRDTVEGAGGSMDAGRERELRRRRGFGDRAPARHHAGRLPIVDHETP